MIRWTDEAKADVEGFTVWLSQRNPRAAARVAEGDLSGIERLTDFPHLGRLGPAAKNLGLRRLDMVVFDQIHLTKTNPIRVFLPSLNLRRERGHWSWTARSCCSFYLVSIHAIMA
jgi:plasmid stabilization system protein ParE